MENHKEKARLLIGTSHYDLARDEILEALKESSEDSECYVLLGQCLHHQGKPEETLEALRKAVALDPRYAYAHYYLAWVYFDRSLREKFHETELLSWSKVSVEEALRLIPEEPSYLCLLATIYYNRQEFKKSLSISEKGLALNPNHQGCLHIRGLALSQLEKPDQAKETIDRSLEINPEKHQVFTTQGWVYWNKSHYRKAKESFEEALRQDPMDSWAQKGLMQARLACHPLNGWAYTYHRFYSNWYWRLIAFLALTGAFTIAFPNYLAPVAIPIGITGFGMMLLGIFTRGMIYFLESTVGFKNSMPDRREWRKKILQVLAGLVLGGALIAADSALVGKGDKLFGLLFVPAFTVFAIVLVFKRPKGLPATRRERMARWAVGFGFLLVAAGILLSWTRESAWSDPAEMAGIVVLFSGILFALFAKKY